MYSSSICVMKITQFNISMIWFECLNAAWPQLHKTFASQLFGSLKCTKSYLGCDEKEILLSVIIIRESEPVVGGLPITMQNYVYDTHVNNVFSGVC